MKENTDWKRKNGKRQRANYTEVVSFYQILGRFLTEFYNRQFKSGIFTEMYIFWAVFYRPMLWIARCMFVVGWIYATCQP